MILYAEVVLPLPLNQTFTYAVPREQAERLCVGMRVLVPFGERMLTGFVIGTKKRRRREDLKLKAIGEVLDESPIFSPSFLSFTRKLSRYFFSPWGEILQAAVPPSFILRSRVSISITAEGREALAKGLLSEEEKDAATWLKQKPQTMRFLQKKGTIKNIAALLARLEKRQLVLVQEEIKRVRRKKKIEPAARPTQLEFDFSLDEKLRRIAAAVAERAAGKTFAPFLLYGSPSRREALYLELIKKALASGGRALYLIPEISLTSVLLEKLEKRLGERVAVLHSEMTEKRRELEWQKIKDQRAEVVIGPRSALFSPLDNVRLIILDEEQDESYSQQEGLPYDVRKAAWLRAEEEEAALIYGSAWPTVESFYRAKKGRYLIDLGTEARRSKVTLADSRKDAGIICRPLQLKLKEKMEKKEPVLLFFNRRGYASSLVCARCGFVPQCVRCDMALSYHKRENRLVCHSCRYAIPAEMNCPRCGSLLIAKRSAGIEAAAEDLKRTFPQRRVEIFAVDEAAGKEEKKTLLRSFRNGEIDILIGTQLLAYQASLPPVSLVGILHPEMALHLADFRSGQKAFQMITRALRFLREDETSEVLIQTAAPDHYSIREAARGDYGAFYDQEIKFRRLMEYPPFSCLAEVFFLGENLRRVAERSREFAERVRNSGEGIKIFGPSRAAVAKVRGVNRIQVNLKARKKEKLDRVLAEALKGIHLKKSIFLFG